MAWALGSVVAAAGVLLSCAGTLLSCAGTLADPPVITDDSSESTTASQATASQALTPRHDPSGAAVIATVRTRDSELTILSEGGNMRYSLLDSAGVSRNLTIDQLRVYDPNLFEFVKTAMARAAAHSGGAFIDARVEPAVSSGTPGVSLPVIPIGAERNSAVGPRGIGMRQRE
jgi:hypothetical protein